MEHADMIEIIAMSKSLIDAIPKIVELVRSGRSAGSIRLSDILSTDALRVLEAARLDGQRYIDGG